jgi:hypothetical protein
MFMRVLPGKKLRAIQVIRSSLFGANLKHFSTRSSRSGFLANLVPEIHDEQDRRQ